jgi:hypothetical protein
MCKPDTMTLCETDGSAYIDNYTCTAHWKDARISQTVGNYLLKIRFFSLFHRATLVLQPSHWYSLYTSFVKECFSTLKTITCLNSVSFVSYSTRYLRCFVLLRGIRIIGITFRVCF